MLVSGNDSTPVKITDVLMLINVLAGLSGQGRGYDAGMAVSGCFDFTISDAL